MQKNVEPSNIRILVIDYEDSFSFLLSSYFKQTGANVSVMRPPVTEKILHLTKPHLVVLSPGPGSPKDFHCIETIEFLCSHAIPIFGVCLGFQAIIEAYGGKLSYLPIPCHGKSSTINIFKQGIIFRGLPQKINVGRYHSICADPSSFPEDLFITACAEDKTIMAFEHKEKPIAGIQFHPESIMTTQDDTGMRIIQNIVMHLPKKD